MTIRTAAITKMRPSFAGGAGGAGGVEFGGVTVDGVFMSLGNRMWIRKRSGCRRIIRFALGRRAAMHKTENYWYKQ